MITNNISLSIGHICKLLWIISVSMTSLVEHIECSEFGGKSTVAFEFRLSRPVVVAEQIEELVVRILFAF